ncbi:hypothetical protein V1294_006026 [Bradyrhizobium sp. AZCC 1678]|uniref:hypothetical protein n=1 Tax=Bradyrhizobium sp. AZCC 1678 TaxID=3117030 RepID=UPI002FF3ECC5
MSLLVVGSVGITLIDGSHPIYPVADYVILGLTVAQLIGLYGYALKRPMLSERLWQLAFPLFTLNLVATLVIGSIRFAAARGDIGVPAATIAALLFGIPFHLPLLLADRRFAFRSTTTIWKLPVWDFHVAFGARSSCPGPTTFRLQYRRHTSSPAQPVNTGLSFDPSAASRKEEHDHGDNDAEGFGERPATAWARRDNSERSSRHRRTAE